MNLEYEIELYSAEEDKPILRWLLSRYPYSSKFEFVADCAMVPYGTQSYQVNRHWVPTKEGRVLYAHREELI